MSKKNSKKDVLILVGAMLKAICIFYNITFCLAKKKVMIKRCNISTYDNNSVNNSSTYCPVQSFSVEQQNRVSTFVQDNMLQLKLIKKFNNQTVALEPTTETRTLIVS